MDLLEEGDICSSASKRGKYRQELQVGGETTRAVSFVIIPMKVGEFPVNVQAAVRDSWITDGVKKMLRVVVSEEKKFSFLHSLLGLCVCVCVTHEVRTVNTFFLSGRDHGCITLAGSCATLLRCVFKGSVCNLGICLMQRP